MQTRSPQSVASRLDVVPTRPPGKIPGWFKFGRIYEAAIAAADGGAVFVEVGSWKGRSAYFMASRIRDSGKQIRFYCVDHWLGSDEDEHARDPAVIAGRLYETFLRNVAPVREFLTPLRMTSLDAARLFPDGSCDLVMIDASHDYESVRADIAAWWPKIKRGGVLAGDDYCWPGVERAVQEAFGARVKVLGKDKGRHWRTTR